MVHFVLGLSFRLWTLSVPLCMVVWTPVEGELQVIGSLRPIIVAPGDDVILPCHLEPDFNVEGLTVEWSKPDLKPDPSDRLSRVEYVHLYRNQLEDPDMKLQSYVGRTELFTDGLKRGNISLKIMNVTLADEGRYKCFIPKLKSKVKESIVELVVDPNSVKTVTTETPLHHTNLQTPDPNDETNVEGRPQVIGSLQPIITSLGDDVILPRHVEPPFNVEQLTVDWWRPDRPPDPEDSLSQYRYVHRYHDSHDTEDMKMSSRAGQRRPETRQRLAQDHEGEAL